MSADQPKTRRLFTEEEIAAAGAQAVEGWRLSDQQCDRLAALLAPSMRQRQSAPADPVAPEQAA
jgi:hypothetical protein